MPSALPVSDYILVTIVDDPFTPTPTTRRFVVEVSRKTISKDLSRGNQSRTRTQFHTTPELDSFIDDHLADVQHTMAGDVALTHAGIIRPQKKPSPVYYSTDSAKAPPHPPNASVGDFRVWDL